MSSHLFEITCSVALSFLKTISCWDILIQLFVRSSCLGVGLQKPSYSVSLCLRGLFWSAFSDKKFTLPTLKKPTSISDHIISSI